MTCLIQATRAVAIRKTRMFADPKWTIAPFVKDNEPHHCERIG